MSNVLEVPAYGPTANFIVSEANGYRSREQIVVAQGGLYRDGTILQAVRGDELKYAPFAGGGDEEGGGALAVLFQTVDAREADIRATGMVRDCELQRAMLKFAGEVSAADREAAYAGLAAAHVVMR
jgi:Bacteriophage lambda head decoration protein D